MIFLFILTLGDFFQINGFNYYVFIESGIFSFNKTILNAEIFIVAGGGAGNRQYQASVYGGGGGGAGGVILTNISLFPREYEVIIGHGGLTNGENGGNSKFSNLEAFGGGGGGSGSNGKSGGAGGGAGKSDTHNRYGGSSISNQGFKGGDAPGINHGGSGGGGGGCSQAGGGTSGNYFDTIRPGQGGHGIDMTDWLFDLPFGHQVLNRTYFAGGGGAGSPLSDVTLLGGNGGGGNGRGTSPGDNGLENTGGGGGGTRTNTPGKGGSGIIIIKYSTSFPTNSYNTLIVPINFIGLILLF